MDTSKIYDIVGIGIGPFNLGLAALASEIPSLECIFIDKKKEFNWHPGMLLPTAKMQVPFYADLVTPVNPGSRFSYFWYLKAMNRTIPFAILEDNYPYRTEYNEYCRWVAAQLDCLHFGYVCKRIEYSSKKKVYTVHAVSVNSEEEIKLQGRHIVIGVGSQPYIPPCVKKIYHPTIFHSSEYLFKKNAALMHNSITLVGSGQSAGEIFLDLLQHRSNWQELHWYTRSDRFHPMDYSKLSLELSSPAYIDYFYSLEPDIKRKIIATQQYLYKGMNIQLIEEIYRQLYLASIYNSTNLPRLFINSELQSVKLHKQQTIDLQFAHRERQHFFEHQTDVLILATGYEYRTPEFVSGIREKIRWVEDGKYNLARNYAIDENNTIFVQNAELHSHGFSSADLGLGALRNAEIINGVLKAKHFTCEKNSTFQTF